MKIPQDIFIPHLRQTVKIRAYKKAPKEIDGCSAYTTYMDDYTSVIYLKPKAPVRLVAHEIVHVLRAFCINRHMNFTDEPEHMAYLMQYILGRIMGRDL